MSEKNIIQNEQNAIIIFNLYDEKTGVGLRYHGYCTCGHEMLIENSKYSKFKCPNCGATYKHFVSDYSLSKNKKI